MGDTGGAGSGPGGGDGGSTGPGRIRAEILYTVTEVAELWRCTRQHIYDLIAAGRLRKTDIGIGRAKTRIPASALSEYTSRDRIHVDATGLWR